MIKQALLYHLCKFNIIVPFQYNGFYRSLNDQTRKCKLYAGFAYTVILLKTNGHKCITSYMLDVANNVSTTSHKTKSTIV